MVFMTEAPEPVLTARQVAEYLGVTPDSVYTLIKRKQLRAVRVGRLLRIPRSALDDFLSGGEREDDA